MSMLPSSTSLWHEVTRVPASANRHLVDPRVRVGLQDLAGRTILYDDHERFRDKSVILHMTTQIVTTLALIELDGVVRRLILCPPDASFAQLQEIIVDTTPDILLTDDPQWPGVAQLAHALCSISARAVPAMPVRDLQSEWLLFTSGTTGRPKPVVHDLMSLTAPLRQAEMLPNAVWSTFYDVRRYGGLTIFLRAMMGGASMMFSQTGEPAATFLRRAGECGVTHISGTPSHWRQAMMSGAAPSFHPSYVRLSGEPADQSVIDMLKGAFPTAKISHAYASTEAGVAFDIRDGFAGFPMEILNNPNTGLDLKVEEGTLRIRSDRTAARYLQHGLHLQDTAGFIDTGDLVELRGNRYFFSGRREGSVNVGGLKVHPEEVEAVINRHPHVQMSLVRGRKSPITGELVIAEIVLRAGSQSPESSEMIKDEILTMCRDVLPAHKVPSRITEVASLKLTPAGKLARAHV